MNCRIIRSVVAGLIAAAVVGGIGFAPAPAAAAPAAHHKPAPARPATTAKTTAANTTPATGSKTKGATLARSSADTGKHKQVRANLRLEQAAFQAATDAVAKTLQMTRTQLQVSLKRGQTLTQLEQAHGVTAAQVQAAALAAGKAALTSGVQRKAWTPAQATAYTAVFEKAVTTWLANLSQHPVKR